MRFRLLRRCTLESIDTIVFPPHLRKITDGSEWVMLAASNSYDVLHHIVTRLYPREDFKIIDTEVKMK